MQYYLRVFFPNKIQDIELRENTVIGGDACPIEGCDTAFSFYQTSDGFLVSSINETKKLAEGDSFKFTDQVNGLLVHRENSVLAEVNVDKVGEVSVGRGLENDLVLPSRSNVPSDVKKTSREHFKLIRTTGGWKIQPQKVQAKVYVGGKLVVGTQSVSSGDIISIGKYSIIFEGGKLRAYAQPTKGVVSRQNLKQKRDQAPRKIASDYQIVDPPAFNRSPHIQTAVPEYELLVPMKERFGDKPEFNWVSTLLPPVAMLIVMLAIFLFTQNAMTLMYTVPMYFVSMIVAVVNHNAQKKNYAKRRASAESSYLSQIESESEQVNHIKVRHREILEAEYPSLDECVSIVKSRDSRMWRVGSSERMFMNIRLGIGNVKTKIKVQNNSRDIDEKSSELIESAKWIKDAPVTCSLLDYPTIGLIGDRGAVVNTAKNVIVQAATNHAYDDLKIVIVYPEEESQEWAWARWLPHVWDNDHLRRYMANDSRTSIRLVRDFEELLNKRANPVGNTGEQKSEHILFVIADYSLISSTSLKDYLSLADEKLNISTLFLAQSKALLPAGCKAIIEVQGKTSDGAWYPTEDSSARRAFALDWMGKNFFDVFSRTMAPIRLADSHSKKSLPTSITFLEGYGVQSVEDLNIADRWSNGHPEKSLSVPVGVKENGDTFYFDIHEKKYGPHGMASGRAGSGKSEMVQSWILSLALNYRPDQVSFVIVDFKGDGLLAPFRGLPHIAGVISNLDHNVERNVIALQQEMNRRMAIFSKYGASNIIQYAEKFSKGEAEEAVPFLIIAVDEFAEIKSSHPEFVSAIDRVYTIGRSLGILIIILAQDAGSVADDKMQANSRFRWCMQVATADASRSMLETTDAFTMPHIPGRGYVKVGDFEVYEMIQSFWSGANYSPRQDADNAFDTTISVVELDGLRQKLNTERDDVGESTSEKEITKVISYIQQYAAENRIPSAMQIWQPALPSNYVLSDILPKEFDGEKWPQSEGLDLYLGMVDDPNRQEQYPLMFRSNDCGHIAVFGGPESGKTTVLLTAALSIAKQYDPSMAIMYLFDFDKWTLNLVRNLPHVHGCTAGAESDEIQELASEIRMQLANRMEDFSANGVVSLDGYRTLVEQIPAIYVFVDNISAAWEDSTQVQDMLTDIAKKGANHGIYLIATAPGTSFPFNLTNFFKTRLSLNQNDRSDYTGIVGRTELTPEPYPGRGLAKIKYPVEFQIAQPVSGEEEKDRNAELHSIVEAMKSAWKPAERMASEVELATNENDIVLGIDKLSQKPVLWSQSAKHCIAISTSEDFQRKETLKKITSQTRKVFDSVVVFDDEDGTLSCCSSDLSNYFSHGNADGDTFVADLAQKLKNQMQQEKADEAVHFQSVCLIISDFGSFYEQADDRTIKTLKGLVQAGAQVNVSVFAFGLMDTWNLYGNAADAFTHALLSEHHAILLGKTANDHQVFQTSLPIEKASKAFGENEGWYVLDKKCRQIINATKKE